MGTPQVARLGALLVVAGCADGGLRTARPAGPEPAVELRRLSNGLSVVSQANERRVTAMRLTVHAGYASDPPGKEGLAHLVEHLAASHSSLGEEWIDAVNGLGAIRVNAFTSPDETAYEAIVPSEQLAALLEVSRPLVNSPVANVDETLLRREQSIVKSEGWLRDDARVPAVVWAELGRMLFSQVHPYSHSEFGSAATVDGIVLADVQDFAKRYYQPGNATLALVGPADARARTAVEGWGATFPKEGARGPWLNAAATGNQSHVPSSREAPSLPDGPTLSRIDAIGGDSRLWFGWTLPSDPAHLDRDGVAIAGVAAQRLRHPFAEEAHPHVSDCSLSLITGERGNMLLGSLRLADEAAPESVLQWVTAQVRRALLDTIQLKKGKLFYHIDPIRSALGLVHAGWLSALQEPLSKAGVLTKASYLGVSPKSLLESAEELSARDPEEIRAYAHSWITTQRVRAVYAPKCERSVRLPHALTTAHSSRADSKVVGARSVEQFTRMVRPPSVAKVDFGTLPNGLSYAFFDWPGARAPTVLLVRARGAGDALSPEIGKATELSLGRFTWLEVGERGIEFNRWWRADSSTIFAQSPLQSVEELARFVIRREREEKPAWPGFYSDSPELPAYTAAPYSRSGELLLRDHPWARSDSVSDVSGVTLEEIQAHWVDAFAPQQSLLVVVGDVSDRATRRLILEEAAQLGSEVGPGSPAIDPVISAPLMWTPIHEVRFERASPRTQLAEFKCLLPNEATPEANLLAGAAARRMLYAGLRRQHALSYDVSFVVDSFRGDPTVLRIRADFPVDRAQEAFGVWETFDSRPAAAVLSSELPAARFALAKNSTERGLTTENVAHALREAWLTGRTFASIEEEPAVFANTPEQAVLDAFSFCREHSVLTFYGDEPRLRAAWSAMLVELAAAQSAPVSVPATTEGVVDVH